MSSTWAVVVNWNGGEDNVECLRSLIADGLAEDRVVFVDNASTDGSPDAVARAFPHVHLIRNERNEGYGHGTNRGVELALEEGAELVFLVNNDVTVPRGMFAVLTDALRAEPELGVVGPRVVYREDPGRLWCAGGRMTYRQNLSVLIGHDQADGPRWRQERDVDYVPGCAMLVRREVFERIGLLDGDYFAYHEDIEFCLKARAAGFGVRLIGAGLAYHAAHASTGGGYNPLRKYMMGVNTIWFLRRYGTPARWLSFFLFDVVTLPFVWALRARRGEGRSVRAKARGLLDGLRGRRVTAETLASLAGESPHRSGWTGHGA